MNSNEIWNHFSLYNFMYIEKDILSCLISNNLEFSDVWYTKKRYPSCRSHHHVIRNLGKKIEKNLKTEEIFVCFHVSKFWSRKLTHQEKMSELKFYFLFLTMFMSLVCSIAQSYFMKTTVTVIQRHQAVQIANAFFVVNMRKPAKSKDFRLFHLVDLWPIKRIDFHEFH